MKLKLTLAFVIASIALVIVVTTMLMPVEIGQVTQRFRNAGVAGLLRDAANRIDGQDWRSAKHQFDAVDLALAWAAQRPSMSIVQIGAYIGDTPNDPLFGFLHATLPARQAEKLETKIVLVEPILEYFDQLVMNYSSLENIHFEQVAISETEGTMDMYRLNVDPEDYGFPSWLSQLSSLKKERVESLWDNYMPMEEAQAFYLAHRVVESVPTTTLQSLLDRYEFENLDLLLIDAEGYDFEILKTLDFDKIRPQFIAYERVLLGDNEMECRNMLSQHGYFLMDWGQDTVAIKQPFNPDGWRPDK